MFYDRQNHINPETTKEYNFPRAAAVQLTIYDIQAHKVRRFVIERKAAGYHSIIMILMK